LSWSDIYQQVFAKNDRVPMQWWGVIVLPDGKSISYVAARFFDSGAQWKDAAGRAIPQEVLVVVEPNIVEDVATISWELPVMNCVREFYRDIYNKNAASIGQFPVDLVKELVIYPQADLHNKAERLDVDLKELPTKKSLENVWDASGTTPLHENVRNVLNMDIIKLPNRIKALLSKNEKRK
jgi:hypothetical protein